MNASASTLTQLEQAIDKLIQQYSELQQDHQSLQKQHQHFMAKYQVLDTVNQKLEEEKANLLKKNEMAKTRVDAMIERLKAIEAHF